MKKKKSILQELKYFLEIICKTNSQTNTSRFLYIRYKKRTNKQTDWPIFKQIFVFLTFFFSKRISLSHSLVIRPGLSGFYKMVIFRYNNCQKKWPITPICFKKWFYWLAFKTTKTKHKNGSEPFWFQKFKLMIVNWLSPLSLVIDWKKKTDTVLFYHY